jgi:hypothetical protein
MKQTFILPHGAKAMYDTLHALDPDKKYRVSVELYRPARSLEQNAYFHAVPLKIIADHTGYGLDDIKAYLMGKAFGSREVEIAGETISRPLKGTSDLNVEQFSWLIEWTISWAAQMLGLTIPYPQEELE